MDSSQNNVLTLIFLVAAVLIFLKLRSVLGRRTGDEPARYERFRADRAAAKAQAGAKPSGDDGKGVSLPRPRAASVDAATARSSDADRTLRMTQFAGGNAQLAQGLIDIASVDARFEPVDFLRGAKAAYEAIVTGFAEGNKSALKSLLADDVYKGFAGAIDERLARKETVEQSFVGIKSADIGDVEVAGSQALITVTFVSELITATRNAAQEVVAGDATRVKQVTDVWTFARDVRSSGPNWLLVATRAKAV